MISSFKSTSRLGKTNLIEAALAGRVVHIPHASLDHRHSSDKASVVMQASHSAWVPDSAMWRCEDMLLMGVELAEEKGFTHKPVPLDALLRTVGVRKSEELLDERVVVYVGTVTHVSPKAVQVARRVVIEGQPHVITKWLPKSQLALERVEGKRVFLRAPRWLAERSGLQRVA